MTLPPGSGYRGLAPLPPGLHAEVGLEFDHVAVAGRRLRDLLPLYFDALGAEFVLGADNPGVGWRAVRLRFGGGAVIELMEPLEGSTFFDSFFARTGSGGMHHLTFLVDDVGRASGLLRDHGYRGMSEPDPAASYQELFLHPSTTGGVLLQLQRRSPGPVALPEHSLEDVLAGRGLGGTGAPSP